MLHFCQERKRIKEQREEDSKNDEKSETKNQKKHDGGTKQKKQNTMNATKSKTALTSSQELLVDQCAMGTLTERKKRKR